VLTAVLLWARSRGGVLPYVLYGVVGALSVIVFIYLAALLVAHLVAFAVLRVGRRRILSLSAAIGAALLVDAPFIRLAASEKSQIGWLADRPVLNLWTVLVEPWFDQALTVGIVCWLLVAAGAVWWRRSLAVGTAAGLVLACCSIVVPFALVLIANVPFGPLYSSRYLSFTTPAFAFLVATAVLALPWRRVVPIALAALLITVVPSYVDQRGPFAKNGGSDLRELADAFAANARPGDAMAFETADGIVPRNALYAYPTQFAGLDDVGLVQSFPASGAFKDRTLPFADLPFASLKTLWLGVGGRDRDCAAIADGPTLAAHGFVAARSVPGHRTTLCEFRRG
jgi:mannosyltransferase